MGALGPSFGVSTLYLLPIQYAASERRRRLWHPRTHFHERAECDAETEDAAEAPGRSTSKIRQRGFFSIFDFSISGIKGV